MDKTPTPSTSDRLARFLERASGLHRDDVGAIVERLIDRLDAIERAEEWRIAA